MNLGTVVSGSDPIRDVTPHLTVERGGVPLTEVARESGLHPALDGKLREDEKRSPIASRHTHRAMSLSVQS